MIMQFNTSTKQGKTARFLTITQTDIARDKWFLIFNEKQLARYTKASPSGDDDYVDDEHEAPKD